MSNQTLAPPRRVRDLISTIKNDPLMGKGITVLGERATEFSDPLVHKMVGIAAHEPARRHFDYHLDEMWASTVIKDHDEIVVGGGFHAAVYASVRCRGGFGKPLVLEESSRAGGAFAISRGPSFYLNSRNRPGVASLPGIESGALNVIPGGVVQPADLSGDEYQRNSDLAFSIRCALSMCADVRTGARVNSVRRAPAGHSRMWEVGGYLDGVENKPTFKVYCDRIVLATGIGRRPKAFDDACLCYDRVLSFTDFMSRMDEPFPTRGMRRVAVIGGGDSGRTAVEALTGQGPTTKMSVAALDFVEQIDWYGTASADILTRDNWVACNRSRYKGIGRLFPKTPGGAGRIQPKQKANSVGGGYECAYVDEVPYDYVIVCTGNAPLRTTSLVRSDVLVGPIPFEAGERPVALYYENDDGDPEEIFIVGPAAGLDIGQTEQNAINGGSGVVVPENSTALFRYSTRTAMLASVLDKPFRRRVVDKPKVEGPVTLDLDPRPVIFRNNGRPFVDLNGRQIRVGDYFVDSRNTTRRGFVLRRNATTVKTNEIMSGLNGGSRYADRLIVSPITRDKDGKDVFIGDVVTKETGYTVGMYYLAGICDGYNEGTVSPEALRQDTGVFYALVPLDDTARREVRGSSFKYKGEDCLAAFSREITKA